MKTKNFFQKNLIYGLSALIPILLMLIIFIVREIYPFGDESFLHIDMYHQYFPFLTEFYHKVKNGESLFYSFHTGIGSNFLALYVYYLASPLQLAFPACTGKPADRIYDLLCSTQNWSLRIYFRLLLKKTFSFRQLLHCVFFYILRSVRLYGRL